MDNEIVSFPFLNNWIEDVRVRYNFSTALYKNRRFVEQRRTLREKILREETFLVTKQEIEKDLLLNTLIDAKDKRIALPLYPELCFTSTTPLFGKKTLDITEDLSNYWNIWNECAFVMIIQEYNIYELIQKNYVTSSSIVLEDAITVPFTGDVEIYPVIFCNLKKIKPLYIHSKVYTLALSFQEIRTYQHTETEEDAQADYMKYNYSKGNPADVIIPDPEVTTTPTEIVITPDPLPPKESPKVIVTSKKADGSTIRTQEVVLNEDEKAVITKVGDEDKIQIAYKYTNKESGNVNTPDDFWIDDVANWWAVETVTPGVLKTIKLINDGEGLGKTVTGKDIDIYTAGYGTYVTTTKQSQVSSITGKREPLFWGFDSYTADGSEPDDFYMDFVAYTPPVTSPFENPENKDYPPPGQDYVDTDKFCVRCWEFYDDGTSRKTQRDSTEECSYFGAKYFAFYPVQNLSSETKDADYFRIYIANTEDKTGAFIPSATYQASAYNSAKEYIGKASGTFYNRGSAWGSVELVRYESVYMIPAGESIYYVIIQMTFQGVEIWYPAAYVQPYMK